MPHRFLLERAPQGEVVLPPAEARHALTVLRVRPGEAVCLCDGRGRQWAARVVSAGQGQVVCEALEELPGNESPLALTLYQGLPKADKLELIVQKATELGVTRLCPVAMARSVAKWTPQEEQKKRERLLRIAQEALKQCGRAGALQILPMHRWEEALCDMRERALMLMPWEEARGVRMSDMHRAHPQAPDVGILIGPEGGIDRAEADAARASGATAVTLGPRILRCETAAICACAAAQQLWGDF